MKFYAVKKGRTVGVYTTWADCEAQVKGFSGAIYKSFPTREAAEQFIGGGAFATASANGPTAVNRSTAMNGSISRPLHESISASSMGDSHVHVLSGEDRDMAFAYIDGSFDKRTAIVGSGGVIVYKGEEIEFSFGTKEKQYAEYWNVSGELLATLYVMEWAKRVGVTQCAIYYDYMGIEMWALGLWKQNNVLTKWYATQMQSYMKGCSVTFHKVKAHTGIVYNERADRLAKEGTMKA